MKPNDERKLTFDEKVELLYQEMMASRVPKPKPAPKPAAIKAEERWAAPKSISAVLQDAQRAEAAATERLRKEREAEREKDERFAQEYRLQCRQAEIDAAWQRSTAYRAELAQWRGCNRGPGDRDWRYMQDWERD
jgi:hypothetical protein